MHNIIFLAILSIFSCGCASQEPAPIEFNTDKHYTNKVASLSDNSIDVIEEEVIIKPLSLNREYDPTIGILSEKNFEEEPIPIPGTNHANTKIIYHEVQSGETIEQIAENYDSSKEEIVILNELTPPYQLQEFQIIKIRVSNDVLNKKNREQTTEVLKNNKSTENISRVTTDYIKPVQGIVISRFGEMIKGVKNAGINIDAIEGTPVKSIANGTVTRVGDSPKFGNLVVVQIEDTNLSVAYAHLKSLDLTVGQKLDQNDIIGYVGKTGDVSKAQLYFAIKEGNRAVNPLKYIPE